MSEELDAKALAAAVGAAVAAVMVQHPKSESSPLLKWVSGIAAALLVFAIGGSGAWVLNSVSEMRDTLSRLDERSVADNLLRAQINNDTTRRLENLESAQRRFEQ